MDRIRPRTNALDGQRPEADGIVHSRQSGPGGRRRSNHRRNGQRGDDHLGRAFTAVGVGGRVGHGVGARIAGSEGEAGAGSIGDHLAARRDDVPVVVMRRVPEGVEERAGQGDALPLVHRLIQSGRDVEVRCSMSTVVVPEP